MIVRTRAIALRDRPISQGVRKGPIETVGQIISDSPIIRPIADEGPVRLQFSAGQKCRRLLAMSHDRD
jgi:hypothetical protein